MFIFDTNFFLSSKERLIRPPEPTKFKKNPIRVRLVMIDNDYP